MESDGVNEIFDDGLRQALTIAAQLAERIARARQQSLMEQRAVSEKAGADAAARYAAEQAAARVALSPVLEDRWWNSASPEQIGAAYETALVWRDQDPDIENTSRYIEDRLGAQGIRPGDTRSGQQLTELLQAKQWASTDAPTMYGAYNHDMIRSQSARDRERMNNALVASYLGRPDALAGTTMDQRTMDRANGLQNDSDELRAAGYREDAGALAAGIDGDAAAGRSDELMNAAGNRVTVPDDAASLALEAQNEESRAGHEWDSAERRSEFALSLHGKADATAIDARMLADISQGTHPQAAVKGGGPNAPAARKAPALVSTRAVSKGGR